MYCCFQCNRQKSDYWTEQPDQLSLWNPRLEPATAHFSTLDDGRLLALTPVAELTIQVLRLNRPQLMAHRLKATHKNLTLYLLNNYAHYSRVVMDLLLQQNKLMMEQQQSLRRQQSLYADRPLRSETEDDDEKE